VPLLPPELPLSVLWGDQDKVTPLAGPVGKFLQAWAAESPAAEFTVLQGTGHCPFDDRPDLASPALLAWLERQWPTR